MYPRSISSNGFNDHHYISTNQIKQIIEAWTQLIESFICKGWDAYLVSVLFHELAGSTQAKKTQMNQAIERIYSRLATRMVRKTQSERWKRYLPIGIFVPDWPVPKYRNKHKKSTIEEVSINDGLHMGGIILGNGWGRIRNSLDLHFKEEKDLYETDQIRSIHVRPITHNLEKTADYSFKALKRRTCSMDDILVLNWGGSAPYSEATRRGIMRAGRRF
jgi:hypothetical protein